MFPSSQITKINFKLSIHQYPIKNKQLLTHCGIVFAVVICFFFLHAAPFFNVSLGWTSLLGVCLLLIISNNEDIKTCLLMVEWASLLFFATLFVLMESLTKIGLIKFIGEKLSDLVKLAAPENQMLVAVLLVLWVKHLLRVNFGSVINTFFIRCPP